MLETDDRDTIFRNAAHIYELNFDVCPKNRNATGLVAIIAKKPSWVSQEKARECENPGPC